ncbi:MAG: hypothetical protein ACJAX5_000394 [Patiriisocius sp.]|jgi:hypothetical protein
MALPITVQIEDELYERTQRLASKRGISVDQLVAQQLERAVAQDEYSRLQQKVAQHRQSNRVARPAQSTDQSAARMADNSSVKSAAKSAGKRSR